MSAVHDLKTGEQLDPFEGAYRRVRAQYEAAQAEADSFGGPCETCRYFRSVGGTLSDDYCMNPLAVSFAFDRAKGRVETKGHLIKTWMTSRPGIGVPDLCGANRQLWEPRSAVQAFKAFSANWWGLYLGLIPIIVILLPILLLT